MEASELVKIYSYSGKRLVKLPFV